MSKNMACMDYPEMDDGKFDLGLWSYGSDFGQAPPELQTLTGQSNYNFQLAFWGGYLKENGILHPDGKLIYFKNSNEEIDELQWHSKEDLQLLLDAREPIENRSHSYKIQPENQGRLIFLSGSPGSGKSATALHMAKNEGFVYYEGDSFCNFANPYVPLEANEPTLAASNQPLLKGFSKEVIGNVVTVMKMLRDFVTRGR